MAGTVEEELGRWLRERGWTLAVAETTTGGLICARIVAVPGCSAYFERGVVAYSKASKAEMLGVPEAVTDRYGAVSKETASALAGAVRRISGTTLGLAETGIAGPIRGRSPKPPGTAYIALATAEVSRCEGIVFEGDRQRVREQIAEYALRMAAAYAESGAFVA